MRSYSLIYSVIIVVAMFLGSCSQDKDEPTVLTIEEKARIMGIDIMTDFILPDFKEINLCQVERGYKIYDNINERTWNYNVIFPPSYNENLIYPVLYLLHGRTSDCDKWIDSIKIDKILDCFYDIGFPEIIVVLPFAYDTYYVDNYLDNIKYESFFIEQFIPEIERNLPIYGDKAHRYVGGFSMGGYGGTYYSLKYPELFSFCYSMSAPMGGRGTYNTPPLVSLLSYNKTGEYPYLIVDIGTNDSFVEENLESHFLLSLLKFPHEFILRQGGHNAQYWRESSFILFQRLQSFIEKNQTPN